MHYIMNKNTPVIEVETAKILNNTLCPCSLKLRSLSAKDVYSWLMHRALPSNRKNADKIYNSLGLNGQLNEISLMKHTHELSINDNYWIKSDNESINYEDISLFKNELNNSLSEIALTGQSNTTVNELTLSAEYTGQGTFPKCFVKEDNNIYMYKSGNIESIKNELYACYIAEVLGVRTTHYGYATLYNTECTKSKIVTNENTNWETAFIMSGFLKEYGYTPQSYAEKFLTKSYTDMIILDAIILNEDRHMKNWSFEFNSEDNSRICLAHSYDYNNAFRATEKTMTNLIFDDDGSPVNVLKAGRVAYKRYGTTLKLKELLERIDLDDIKINKEALKNRIKYILVNKDNQSDCY